MKGCACSKKRIANRILVGNIWESGHFEDQEGHWSTALRGILGKQDVRAGSSGIDSGLSRCELQYWQY
jgi:hypothetical protein